MAEKASSKKWTKSEQNRVKHKKIGNKKLMKSFQMIGRIARKVDLKAF